MSEKRYAIVGVDNSCPAMLDDFGCIIARNILHCKCGEDTKNYGDTKEQFIKKVAQVLYKEELDWYAKYPKIIPNGKIDEPFCRNIYEHCLDKATKIVEFLGVEE